MTSNEQSDRAKGFADRMATPPTAERPPGPPVSQAYVDGWNAAAMVDPLALSAARTRSEMARLDWERARDALEASATASREAQARWERAQEREFSAHRRMREALRGGGQAIGEQNVMSRVRELPEAE